MKNSTITRGGVCKSLPYSPYVFTYVHNGIAVNLFFSSKLHLEKFTKNRKKNYVMIYNDIYRRYKYGIDCTFLSDFNLYRKVETRGFYIKYGDNVLKCDSNIKL